MSILLTGSEIEALEIKHKPQNGPGSFMAYSRAIQLALIEKLRKEPACYHFRDDPACFAMPGSGYSLEYPTEALDITPLYRLPTPQELENEL